MEPIETLEEYREYLLSSALLIAEDPDPKTENGQQLEKLANAIQDYEKKMVW